MHLKLKMRKQDEKGSKKTHTHTQHTPKLITSTRNLQTGSCDYKSYTTGGFSFCANNNEKRRIWQNI